MRIGIIGSRTYESKRKIRDMIFKLREKFGSDLTIVSGGCKDGADKYAKKYALELDCKYIEFNPAHTQRNLYSALHDAYYGKEYNVKFFFQIPLYDSNISKRVVTAPRIIFESFKIS